jgi:hypothetical protein
MSITELETSEETLFCPGCGYDLRGSPDGPCSECGMPIDRASLRVSAFPWAHRRKVGRVRAYVRTVWLVLSDSRALAYETAKPQDPADARSFARINGVLAAMTLLLPFFAAMADAGGMGFLAVPPNDSRGPWLKEWQQDVIVPWATGVTLWPVVTLCIVLFGFYLARAALPMFTRRGAAFIRPERAAAIALYATAPLALLPLAPVILWGSALMMSFLRGAPVSIEAGMLLVITSMAFATIAFVSPCARVGQWLARVRRAGAVTAVVGAVGLLLLWIAGAFVFFGVVPWCLGFLWLVIDSLR